MNNTSTLQIGVTIATQAKTPQRLGSATVHKKPTQKIHKNMENFVLFISEIQTSQLQTS